MLSDKFVWDEDKEEINIKKHGITFGEASEVFEDTNALLDADPDHSLDEDRFIILRFSKKARLLMVCHCYRDNDSAIRIISARKATAREEQRYGGA